MTTERATRLHVLIARSARQAVVLRRGPTDEVLVLKWDLAADTLVEGQWFRGRIYEERCDLSPNGELLVYFAAKHERHVQYGNPDSFPTWTAISRPPYLTALTLWPDSSTWGGGGVFRDNRTLLLNYRYVPRSLPDKDLPVKQVLEVLPRGKTPDRMALAGWQVREQNVLIRPSVQSGSRAPVLVRIDLGRGGVGEPFWKFGYAIESGRDTHPLEGVSWADWDHNGDLLCARDGELLRVRSAIASDGLIDAKVVVDLSGLVFAHRLAPVRYEAGWR